MTLTKEHKPINYDHVATDDMVKEYMENFDMDRSRNDLFTVLYETIGEQDQINEWKLTFPEIIQTINVLKASFVKQMLECSAMHSNKEMQEEMR